jgi:ABC-type transport system involved in multi-copper enzyme maturation permease subunit
MPAALTFARLTILELRRRRVLLILLGLTVVSVALVGWGTERLVSLAREAGVNELQVRIGVSQVLILIAFMFSFVLAMSAAFLAAPAIASDVESGTALAILARPVRRADLVLGRWLGLTAVIAAYAIGSGLLAIGVVGWTTGHIPPEPLLAVAFLAFESVVVLTLALALGTRLPAIAAGAVTVVVFGLAWFAGVLRGLAVVFDAPPVGRAADVIGVLVPTDGLWRGVVYGLEPPLVVMLAAGRARQVLEGNPFYAAAPPPLALVAWAVAWVGLVLAVGTWLFRRREV